MVKGGFQRKNAPARGAAQAPDDEAAWDWGFVYTNEDLRRITKTKQIREFCEVQFLLYLAHVVRMPDSAIQKQILFADLKTNKQSIWIKVDRLLGVDPEP